MKIHLVIFISSLREKIGHTSMMKTFESNIRPVQGDIIDDPGFHPKFHNGYEVIKVSINYTSNECFVSLQPLVLDLQEIGIEMYIKRLETHGWRHISKEELQNI